MSYERIMSKVQFGENLKKCVREKNSIQEIADWAYSVYLDWEDVQDVSFLRVLLSLNKMEIGLEFEYSYEELLEIAEDLIACKDVVL